MSKKCELTIGCARPAEQGYFVRNEWAMPGETEPSPKGWQACSKCWEADAQQREAEAGERRWSA